jgi:hypothetical protein
VSRALAKGDIDNDGDLDLLITSNGGACAVVAERGRQSQQRASRAKLSVRKRTRAASAHAFGSPQTAESSSIK